ncbi:metal ABC transporter ATP-binding protein [Sulfoacidibacillus thermotolerans]|uniref:ABC transporter ATP-binding protein n=1 Tax=Sulfoacidibacillus thermotolerans TaxID=1765684 RepID=A0A2U3D602_SULT2|nr:ATP-binding cassette domain-containing protein [Sulfoacidibacillus thermotolerans]PWI56700.1 ABC transporter ATP-binding protein [Sulfoacidibacillus thermotolerans]
MKNFTETTSDDKQLLTLENIQVIYGQRTILKNINLSIRSGEFVGLIGPNGAGKTTLLRVILGLIKPTQGTASINGIRIQGAHRRLVGYVPQKIQLDPDIPLRARDLVALGLDGHRFGFPLPNREKRHKVDEVLHAVDALRYAELPVGRLSGGEQQRLLIAQALLSNPRLLLLDEPLSNLDLRSAHEVIQLVADVARTRKIAVLLVAHDMNPLLHVMDKIIYLVNGQAAIGTLDEVVQKEVLSKIYGYEVEVLRIHNRILVVSEKEDECGMEAQCDHKIS